MNIYVLYLHYFAFFYIMKNMKTPKPLHTENIIHKTGSSPFSLHHTIINPDLNNALYLHCHPEAEFFIMEKGKLDFYVETSCYRLKEGDAIFIPPGMLHNALRCSGDRKLIRYSAIVFSTEPMERCFPASTSPYFEGLVFHRSECVYTALSGKSENKKLISGISEILKYRNKEISSCELTIQGLLFVCWQELYNIHLSKIHASTDDNSLSKNLLKSMDYMQMHYSEPLTLSLLSKISGYSESYYCHSFHDYTGSTPFEYLNRIRIVKACELLSTTDKKITDIASLAGFNNISYFNRTFTKIMGATPSAYRRS